VAATSRHPMAAASTRAARPCTAAELETATYGVVKFPAKTSLRKVLKPHREW
jgi:hypothetical protein